MRSAWVVAGLLGLSSSCSSRAIEPRAGRAQGGEWVVIHGEDFSGHGGVVVTFADVPGRATVIESERRIRVNTPSVPIQLRGKPLPVRLVFADGEQRELDATFTFEVGRVQIRDRE